MEPSSGKTFEERTRIAFYYNLYYCYGNRTVDINTSVKLVYNRKGGETCSDFSRYTKQKKKLKKW